MHSALFNTTLQRRLSCIQQ